MTKPIKASAFDPLLKCILLLVLAGCVWTGFSLARILRMPPRTDTPVFQEDGAGSWQLRLTEEQRQRIAGVEMRMIERREEGTVDFGRASVRGWEKEEVLNADLSGVWLSVNGCRVASYESTDEEAKFLIPALVNGQRHDLTATIQSGNAILTGYNPGDEIVFIAAFTNQQHETRDEWPLCEPFTAPAGLVMEDILPSVGETLQVIYCFRMTDGTEISTPPLPV